jgi:hypothetical protein
MTDVFAVVTECQVLTLEGRLEIIDVPEIEEEMSAFEINRIGATKTSEIVEANTHFFTSREKLSRKYLSPESGFLAM